MRTNENLKFFPNRQVQIVKLTMINISRSMAVMAAAKIIFLFVSVSRHIRAQLSLLKAHGGNFNLLFPCK